MVLVHPDKFIEPGSCMLRRHAKYITESNEFRWRATFGAPAPICCDIWHRISPETTMPNGAEYAHLLWGLIQMKMYPSEASACAIVAGRGEAPDEKTYRKWSKLFISAISLQSTSVIRWENRLLGDPGNVAHVSVDGTDFEILEPHPFSTAWYSHKFKGPGLRYEVGVSIQNGHVVWVNGPYPCGSWPDIKIFRGGLKDVLDDGEMVIADAGYRGEAGKILTPLTLTVDEDLKDAAGVIRARHETCNRRFKVWGCLKQKFRHNIPSHQDYFLAVAVIEQLRIEAGETLFEPDVQWLL